MEVNQLTAQVIDAAMKVHSALGPGLLEGAYGACLRHELSDLTYLKFSRKKVGLLLNFTSCRWKTGSEEW